MSDRAADGRPFPVALTIAGHDPSGGAGITADLLVFASHGLFGISAITALTVQSTLGVEQVEPVRANFLKATLRCLTEDIRPLGVKIGMLATADNVRTVAAHLRELRRHGALSVVLDPVIVSSSGAALLDEDGLAALRTELLPLVDAVTPNLQEAARLSGLPVTDAASMEAAARLLRQRYPSLTVVVTGGHLNQPRDLVMMDGSAQWIAGERVDTSSTHGTGCIFSSALLSDRVAGRSWAEAAAAAQRFVRTGLQNAPGVGHGTGPLDLLAMLSRPAADDPVPHGGRAG